MRILGIIPARWAATRLPGKPLADLGGRPLVEHVWRRARAARSLTRVLVATDDRRIADAVRGFGGEAVLTPRACASGTDRLAHAVRTLPCDLVVNLQGDEPFLSPAAVDRLVAAFRGRRNLLMATLSAPLPAGGLQDPHAVKVVCDPEGFALYFSRAAIPYPRAGVRHLRPRDFRLHLGIYAYRRSFLLRFASWPQTPLERVEQLEQLRALEHGVKIKVVGVSRPTLSVDTLADLDQARRLLATHRRLAAGSA